MAASRITMTSRDDPRCPAVVESVLPGRHLVIRNLPRADRTPSPGIAEPDMVAADGGMIRELRDDMDMARVLGEMRDMGVAMAAGREWSPSEQFERLRDDGLLHGSYDRIADLGGGRLRIEHDQ